MRDESIFAKHWRLISSDKTKLSAGEKEELNNIEKTSLPELRLSRSGLTDRKSTTFGIELKKYFDFFNLNSPYLKVGVASFAALILVLTILFPGKQSDEFRTKGSSQLSVYYSRDGKVQPLPSQSELVDGDRVGASIVHSKAGYAFWAITDSHGKLLSDASDIRESQIKLTEGVKVHFKSSFELVAPNQGEQLVVIVCSLDEKVDYGAKLGEMLDHTFINKLLSEKQLKGNDCVFAGYKLRSLK